MSTQQVETLLGMPDSVSFFLPATGVPLAPPATEEWYYSFGDIKAHRDDGHFVVYFVTGRVDKFRLK